MRDDEFEARLNPELRRRFDAPQPVESVPELSPGSNLAAVIREQLNLRGGVAVRGYRTAIARSDLRVLFVHGGGFTAGTLEQFDAQCDFIARQTGAVVTSVGYRLAPAARYPQILADVSAAWHHVHDGAARTAIVGSSAGAAIAAGMVVSLRDAGGPLPNLLMLHAPVLDDRHDTVSSHQITHPRVFHREASRRAWALYLGETDDPHAAAVPARADRLDGFPPTFLSLGDLEVARDEALEFARRLAGAGTPVELHVYPGAHHGFDVMAPETELSRASLAAQAAALRRALR